MRFPVLAAILSVVLVLACDLYIFFDIRRYCRRRRALWTAVYVLLTLGCWALVVAVFEYPKEDPFISLTPLMWMLYAVMSLYVPKVVYCICSLAGRLCALPAFHSRRKVRNHGVPAGALLAALVFIFMWWGALVTPRQVEVNSVEISSARLPESFRGFKVMQFSDAHLGTWGTDTTFIAKVVDSINAHKPDLILFTGDIVSRSSHELDPFVKTLSRLRAKHGVMAVHGNHDYASYVKWTAPMNENKDVARLDSLMRSMNWKVLNNAAEFVVQGGDSIVVMGVENWGEPPFTQLGDLGVRYPDGRNSIESLNDGNFKILMTHNPNHWSQVVTKVSNIDLSLSGHTHAMQFMLGSGKHRWSPSQYRYKQWGGLYTDKAEDGTPMNLYVNIGLGEVGYPARFGTAKPELTLFTLKKAP